MDTKEVQIFNDILLLLKAKKNSNPTFYNNDKTKYLFKDELLVSNNVRKGIIMLKQKNKYIVDIYVDNGIDNIVNGLLDTSFDNYEIAKQEYNKFLEYINTNDLFTILSDGKNTILKYA